MLVKILLPLKYCQIQYSLDFCSSCEEQPGVQFREERMNHSHLRREEDMDLKYL